MITMNEPGGQKDIERFNVKLPSFKELTKRFSGTSVADTSRPQGNIRSSSVSISHLSTIPRTIPMQQQVPNGNYVLSAYYQIPVQAQMQVAAPNSGSDMPLQLPMNRYQTGTSMNSGNSIPGSAALAPPRNMANINRNHQPSSRRSQSGSTWSDFDGFNNSPTSRTTYQGSVPISPMTEPTESPLKQQSHLPTSLGNLKSFLVETKTENSADKLSAEALLEKLDTYNSTDLKSLEASTSKLADFLRSYRVRKNKNPTSTSRIHRPSSHLLSRPLWPSSVHKIAERGRKDRKKSETVPRTGKQSVNKYKRHAHSKSDTMAIRVNKKFQDTLAWDQSYSNSNHLITDDGQQARQSFEQLSPGEKITLKVEPLQPATNNRVRSSFAPQGILHQDLSIKPKIKCMQCGSESTPEWRKGPDGARTLCNACGLFHNKLVKKMGPKAAAEFLETKRMSGKPGERQYSYEDIQMDAT